MNILVEVLYVIFAFVGTYFMFLFLLLFVSGRKDLRKIPEMKKYPSLSILIPAYNEEKVIEKTIKNVKKMLYPKKLDIIVIDDGSSDRTYEIAKKQGIRIFKKKNEGTAAGALNFGLKKAKGEIVAVIDSDSYPKKDALLKAIPFFSEKGVASVTTSIFVKSSKKLIEKLQKIEYIMIAWSRKLLESLNSIFVTPGPLSLYRTSVLKRIGGFDKENMTEDIEIAWRLMSKGYKIKMALNSEVYTNPPNTFRKWWHQRIRWNIGGIQTFFKYFHLFLNRKFSNIGMFLLPFFSISYVLSFLGLIAFSYIIIDTLYNSIPLLIGSYFLGINPFSNLNIMLLPNLFIILGLFMLILSLAYIKINLKTIRKPLGKGWLISLFVYIIVYIGIFPFNLMHSTWKFLRKSYKW